MSFQIDRYAPAKKKAPTMNSEISSAASTDNGHTYHQLVSAPTSRNSKETTPKRPAGEAYWLAHHLCFRCIHSFHNELHHDSYPAIATCLAVRDRRAAPASM